MIDVIYHANKQSSIIGLLQYQDLPCCRVGPSGRRTGKQVMILNCRYKQQTSVKWQAPIHSLEVHFLSR